MAQGLTSKAIARALDIVRAPWMSTGRTSANALGRTAARLCCGLRWRTAAGSSSAAIAQHR
ncbi:hypothetical protein [Rhodoferax saidenbachensis]|uniref:hypothetical protein n=1 Tax=Rhodoferax saidenbachensis TaxID=1484693 RepID=UPI0038F7B9A0